MHLSSCMFTCFPCRLNFVYLCGERMRKFMFRFISQHNLKHSSLSALFYRHNATLVVCRPQTKSLILSSAACTYVSRAHAIPVPEYSVPRAFDMLLTDAQARSQKRRRKYKRNVARGKVPKCSGKHLDETLELALNLNLDPRKPGQSLRGKITLPHGTGKTVQCLVFTNNDDLAQQARDAGAVHAGGDSLVEEIVTGTLVGWEKVARSLSTPDMMTTLTKRAARILGPRGLMPNVKTGTLVEPDQLVQSLQQASTEVLYRTDRAGIVHVPIGRASFGITKLIENFGQILKNVHAVKPEQYGKGKKASKNAKYFLRASICSTQGPGIRLDLRTVDPTSPFFISSLDGDDEIKNNDNNNNSNTYVTTEVITPPVKMIDMIV